MRGLPSCGKSHMARRLAGGDGLVCETDAFFHSEVGTDPASYDYDAARLPEAREWCFERFLNGIDDGVPVIVVDRGNSLSAGSAAYAIHAVRNGYDVVLSEPDSPWWQEIRVLLKYKRHTKIVLFAWAERLVQLSRRTHRVPLEQILHLMARWRYNVTVEDILKFGVRMASETREPAGTGMTAAEAAARLVLPTGFGVTTGLVEPVYFNAATGGVDFGMDGGGRPVESGAGPLTPELIFDEGRDTLVPADPPQSWSIDAGDLDTAPGSSDGADDWIVE
jgi:hypothetical protein